MSAFTHDDPVKGGYVYIMTNGVCGTLYIGVTADLSTRVHFHRIGKGSDFSREHGLTRLVYAESHEDIGSAIAREKLLKRWKRAWKLNLIEKANPGWRDLYEEIIA